MPTRHTVIVDRTKDWKWEIDGIDIVTANDYLTKKAEPQKRP